MAGNAKILLYKKATIMKIKNLYSFFTKKLQTRIMNKTNIYPIHQKRAKIKTHDKDKS